MQISILIFLRVFHIFHQNIVLAGLFSNKQSYRITYIEGTSQETVPKFFLFLLYLVLALLKSVSVSLSFSSSPLPLSFSLRLPLLFPPLFFPHLFIDLLLSWILRRLKIENTTIQDHSYELSAPSEPKARAASWPCMSFVYVSCAPPRHSAARIHFCISWSGEEWVNWLFVFSIYFRTHSSSSVRE